MKPQAFRIVTDPSPYEVKTQIQHHGYEDRWGMVDSWANGRVVACDGRLLPFVTFFMHKAVGTGDPEGSGRSVTQVGSVMRCLRLECHGRGGHVFVVTSTLLARVEVG